MASHRRSLPHQSGRVFLSLKKLQFIIRLPLCVCPTGKKKIEIYGYTKTLLPPRIHLTDAANKPWEFFYWGILCVPRGLGDSEMWIRHTEDPSQGQGEHHSLAIIRSYLKLEGGRGAGHGMQKARGTGEGGLYLRGCSHG